MSLEYEKRMSLEYEKRMSLEDEKRKKTEEVKRKKEEEVKKEVIESIEIGDAKLQVDRRVVYRASAGCVDRLGTVMGVHKTFMNEKYCYTYSVQLDPIIVKSSSLQVPSDKTYCGEDSQVIFTEQEVWNDKVWNDTVSGKFFHYSNAIVMEVDRNSLTCTIQLDNVRAQNEMIRNTEESDEIKSAQTPVWHISKKSLGFWEEDADMQFGEFSAYYGRLRCAAEEAEDIKKVQDSDEINSAQHISKKSLGFWEEYADLQFGEFSDYDYRLRCAAEKVQDSDDTDLY